MEIPKKYSDCAFYEEGEVCLSDKIIDALAELYQVHAKTRDSAFNEIKEKTKCDSESCVLSKSKVIKQLGSRVIEKEKEEKLKPTGPRDDIDQWFSNFDIEAIMNQWVKARPGFYAYPFAMIDFMQMGHELKSRHPMILYQNGYRCYGCVVNTDVSTGGGKHWMAVFGDMRRDDVWTVEYFNSSGIVHKPMLKYLAFASTMMRTIINMYDLGIDVKEIISCQLRHQKGGSECGPYSLYYIWSRLNEVPYQKFSEKEIPDTEMHKFRKYLFREVE